MKQILLLIVAACLLSKAGAQAEQEKLDLPGDNLNLYSVLKVFQESPTLEGFEKKLNDESSKINNLDLNGDNNIDYITVADQPEGDIHNITLKVSVSKDETQDVAVIVVQKDSKGRVQIQVIGDEDLYGKNYIIEPNNENEEGAAGNTPNPGYSNPNPAISNENTAQNNMANELSGWPLVQFIFVPGYVSWRSPWYWNNYPSYWRPWTPYYWHTYYGYHYFWNYYYNAHYRRWNTYRFPGWYNSYYSGGFRSRSPIVQVRYSHGDYRNTYSKPALAKEGAAIFRRDNPKAPSVKNKLPSFDNSGTPIITRPVVTKPVSPSPAINPVTRPLPATTEPMVTRPDARPVTTQPVTPTPATRPISTRPGTIRPAIDKPVTTLPVTAQPAITQPVVSPKPQRPPIAKPITNRPVTRPINNPVPLKPAASRPVQQPVNTMPATTPTRQSNARPPVNKKNR